MNSIENPADNKIELQELANHEVVYVDNKPKTNPYTFATIRANAESITGDWPRRVEDTLFSCHGDDVTFFLNESALFAYYHALAQVNWTRGARFITKAEYFAGLRQHVTKYVAIESLPHEPAIPDHFYMGGHVASGNGDHLRWLLDRFNPSTDADYDLLTAAFVTPGWGGSPGARPAFCITSDHGRGVGKTTVAKLVCQLWQSDLWITHLEDIGKVKTRMLSPGARTSRVVLLDNVKSLKFSWDGLRALITCNTISGYQLYEGDGKRTNTLTYFVTLNGASLSTDMAQRCVIIKLDRHTNAGSWEDDTKHYIEENRQAIIGDVLGLLRSESPPLAKFTRWAAWERDVLAHLNEPSEAQRVIAERQVEADVEAIEAGSFEDFIAERLADLHYEPNQWVYLSSNVANAWYCESENTRITKSKSTQMLKQMTNEGQLKRLQICQRHDLGRGFIWAPTMPPTSVSTDLEQRLEHAERRKHDSAF